MQEKDNPSGDPAQLPLAAAQQQHDSAAGQGVSSDSSVSSQGILSGIDSQLPPVDPFPVDVLPGPARKLAEEGGAALGVPPDLVAVPLLAFAGATIGNTSRIELKPGYEQYPILFTATVAPPGAAKSPALNLALYPLGVLQQEAEAKKTHSEWSSLPKDAPGQEPGHPPMEHFFSTNSTTEAIAMMLGTSAGLALVSDELLGWVEAFDAYRGGRGGDRQFWLSAWSGFTIKVDRKTSDSIIIPEPVICVSGGAQPDMLSDLTPVAGRRDGFLERILLSYPDTPPSGWTESIVPQETKDDVVDVFRQLRKPAGDEPVRLSAQAKTQWVEWYDDNAVRIYQQGGYLAGVYAKLHNHAARFALILHCLKNPGLDGPQLVDSETMEGALRLAEYFRSHAHRADVHFVSEADTHTTTLTKRILRVLRAAQGGWVDRTALHKLLGGHEDADALTYALSVLEAEGLAEQRVVSNPKGGRPKEEWRAITPSEETNKPKKP